MAPLPDPNLSDPEAIELKSRLSRGELPTAEAPALMAPGETCHFACAVRFGRRRADQFGHLVLSAAWLQFRGALDLRVAWSQIAVVRADGRDIIVALKESSRPLRFSCHAHAEAVRGAIIAEHLALEQASRRDAQGSALEAQGPARNGRDSASGIAP